MYSYFIPNLYDFVSFVEQKYGQNGQKQFKTVQNILFCAPQKKAIQIWNEMHVQLW